MSADQDSLFDLTINSVLSPLCAFDLRQDIGLLLPTGEDLFHTIFDPGNGQNKLINNDLIIDFIDRHVCKYQMEVLRIGFDLSKARNHKLPEQGPYSITIIRNYNLLKNQQGPYWTLGLIDQSYSAYKHFINGDNIFAGLAIADQEYLVKLSNRIAICIYQKIRARRI